MFPGNTGNMEIHSGTLTVKVPSLLKPKMYSNFWCVLYSGQNNFSPRIDLYEDKAHFDQKSTKKTIYIEEAKWKRAGSLEPVFSFEVKHSKQYIFSCNSESELRFWIVTLCCVSKDLFDSKHIIGIQDFGPMASYFVNEDGEEIVVEENALYSSSEDMSTFTVLASQTEGCCLQHEFKGAYKLHIGSAYVQLLNLDSVEITCWSLQLLKYYGFNQHSFFLQAGSRSLTGPGKFIFHTTEGGNITRFIKQKAESLIKQNHKLENSTQSTGATVATGYQNQASLVASKPPAPPSKPKPLSIRNSSTNTEKHGNSHNNGEVQLSKKGMPAFGVPVFAPPARQRSPNLSASSPGEYELARRESLNNGDHANNNLAENGKMQLRLTRSESSTSSEVGHKKDSKKAQKELKKEQRKRADEEKKERRKQEEEKKKEQRIREEEEKKKKKEQKKSKMNAGRSLSNSSQSVSLSHSESRSGYADADLSSYTEVNITRDSHLNTLVNPEKIYSEPWGNLPEIFMPAGVSTNEVIYAQPEKKLGGKGLEIEPREIVHTENYEECHANESEHMPPVIIPPNWEQEEDDPSMQVYSHLNKIGPILDVPENVYGIASASAPASVFVDENPYEDTSIPLPEL